MTLPTKVDLKIQQLPLKRGIGDENTNEAMDQLNKFGKLKMRKLNGEDDRTPEHCLEEHLEFQQGIQEDNLIFPESPKRSDLQQTDYISRSSEIKAKQVPSHMEAKRATTFDGRSMTFGYDRMKRIEDCLNLGVEKQVETKLLCRSVYSLMEELQCEEISKESASFSVDVISEEDNYQNDVGDSMLFVNKYQPRNYMELTSDYWINHQVLLWLKQWDHCVHNKSHSEQVKKSFRFTRDRLGRPDKKVLLLTGPPGLGKTTLVHVLARQCGYNVIEINASDERSGNAVTERIKNAISFKSQLVNQKPNLVVIDEIDGAMGGTGDSSFIKQLVDIVNPRNPKKDIMKRPIICICNDPYVPALRPLRVQAQIFNFRQPSTSEIMNRLRFIAENEGVKIDSRALSLLVEKSNGDIRTCLNTLQMLKTKLLQQHRIETSTRASSSLKQPRITLEMVNDSSVGMKDMQKSIFAIWDSIFFKKYQNNNSESNDAQDFANLQSLIESNGEYEILVEGCFENYLKMDFRDSANVLGSSICNVLEFVSFYDETNARMFQGHPHTGPMYVPFAMTAFRAYCKHSGQKTRDLLTFPINSISNRKQHRQSMQIVSSFLDNIEDFRARNWMNSVNFVPDILQYLLLILTPQLRAINPTLLKGNEKEIFDRLINQMISLNLTFVKQKSSDAQKSITLDPPIDSLLVASDKMKQSVSLKNSIKQVIAAEIHYKTNREEITTVSVKSKKREDKKEKKIVEIVERDFFGRVIKKSTEVVAVPLQSSKKQYVEYKFHEGYSNAVRRSVMFIDLF